MVNMSKEQNITVLNKYGNKLNTCTQKRANRLVGRRRAIWCGKDTIKLIVNDYDKKKIREKVMSRANRTCYICNTKIADNEPLTIDHVIPRSGRGRDTVTNLQCCCKRCNDDKADRDLLDYSTHMIKNRDKYDYLDNERIAYLVNLGVKYRINNGRGTRNEKDSLFT